MKHWDLERWLVTFLLGTFFLLLVATIARYAWMAISYFF